MAKQMAVPLHLQNIKIILSRLGNINVHENIPRIEALV